MAESGEEPSVPRDVSKERARWISCQALFCRCLSQACCVSGGDPSLGGRGAGAGRTGRAGGGIGSLLSRRGLGIPGMAMRGFLDTGFCLDSA